MTAGESQHRQLGANSPTISILKLSHYSDFLANVS